MKAVFALTCATWIIYQVVVAVGHGKSLSQHYVDRKELLKNILWHYFWQKDIINAGKGDVGFVCSMSSRYTTTASVPIKFQRVIRNDGKGYSNQTGIFTAPVGGLYHFYWSLLAYKSKPVAIDLKHNGNMVGRVYFQGLPKYESPSNTIYLRVKKDDKIYLASSGNGGVIHEDLYTIFGGEFIRY